MTDRLLGILSLAFAIVALVALYRWPKVSRLVTDPLLILVGILLCWAGIEFFGHAPADSSRKPYTVIGRTEGVTDDVYSDFQAVYESEPALGNPLRPIAKSQATYQAVYEHAVVLWVKPLLRQIILPMDQSKKVIQQPDPDVNVDRKFFDPDYLRKTFKPPKGMNPPTGGLARNRQLEPQQWQWLGWMLWECGSLTNTFYYQEFDGGLIAGIFKLAPAQSEGRLFVVLNSGVWSERGSNADAPECK
jgi:hypothetical protein